jgi:hypothetical protein
MYSAKDLSQQFGVGGTRLQFGEALLHPVQPFLALRDKFFSQVVHNCYIGRWPLTISATRLAIVFGTR